MASIALQLYSIRDIAAADLVGTLARIAEIGYDGVEFASYYGVDPAAVRQGLADAGIAATGAHISVAQLEEALEAQIEEAKLVGCPMIGCPGFWNVDYNLATFERMADLFTRSGEACADAGLGFYYHLHGHEFVEVAPGKSGMDVLLERTDPQLVTLQPDVYWVARAGIDPVAFVRDHAARCSSLHLKDAANQNDWRDTEVGAGIIDTTGVVAAAPEVSWWIVEQEAFEMDPMESIAVSLGNLRALATGSAQA
jgi:sugar phosphate isomerase/epimerase